MSHCDDPMCNMEKRALRRQIDELNELLAGYIELEARLPSIVLDVLEDTDPSEVPA